MHAVIQSVEVLVVALAATALAHFGVTLKQTPCPAAAPAAHRASMLPDAAGRLASMTQASPCPPLGRARRA